MNYFVMTCDGVYPSASIGKGPGLDDAPWFLGQPIVKSFSEPLVYELDPKRLGNICVMYDDMAYPLIQNTLIEALHATGVLNLQLFDAIIVEPESGFHHTHHKAFNITGGLIAAADMKKSKLMGTSDSKSIDVDFAALTIDEDKAKASRLRLFRLAENVSTIIVDEVVKNEITRRNIPGMVFYEPQDWSG